MEFNKMYITEHEFDVLNYAEQRSYKWCPYCAQFYHAQLCGNKCLHYKEDARD